MLPSRIPERPLGVQSMQYPLFFPTLRITHGQTYMRGVYIAGTLAALDLRRVSTILMDPAHAPTVVASLSVSIGS